MSHSERPRIDPATLGTRPVPAAAGEPGKGRELPLPLYGALIFTGIRVLSLAIAALLLPRGKFRELHYSLLGFIKSWDSGRYLIIAFHGYSYVPGDIRHDSIFAWFPGYPAAIRAVAWVSGAGAVGAGLGVTMAAGLAAAWGLTRLGMTLTGDRRVSLLTTALWAAAPGSIALSMVYSEALFCALAIWCLIALVERHWLTAACLTVLAGTVRSTAQALVAAVMVATLLALIRAARTRRPIAAWWRPAVALLLAPLGLFGYWGYVAWAVHRPGGWFWVEKNLHLGLDWGQSILLALKNALIDEPTAFVTLTLLVIAAAVALAVCSLTERMPVYVHVYTQVVVLIALATGPDFFGGKPRFLLPAVLLGLPLARLLVPARTWVLIPLIAMFAAASTWFGLYLMSVGWAP
ncbi:MAG TPA: mannosyltransferase family protein [Streptosporangiaceae bacterium]|nr:mannosyltransferase family protein [Streptosporangiaceae bacterium]